MGPRRIWAYCGFILIKPKLSSNKKIIIIIVNWRTQKIPTKKKYILFECHFVNYSCCVVGPSLLNVGNGMSSKPFLVIIIIIFYGRKILGGPSKWYDSIISIGFGPASRGISERLLLFRPHDGTSGHWVKGMRFFQAFFITRFEPSIFTFEPLKSKTARASHEYDSKRSLSLGL